jgi:antitoxin component YwqK of YwqJK toxin-antitoxin module
MVKYFFLMFFLLQCFCSFGQNKDSLAAEKWVNYKRNRSAGDDNIHNMVNKQYITREGDTLTRSFFMGGDFHQILKEQSFIHNKQNGLEIIYHPNGNIQQISYYLDGKLWDVISRADSNGKLQHPGNLHNGNGVRFFSDRFGIEPDCYMTYRNGVPEGLFIGKILIRLM